MEYKFNNKMKKVGGIIIRAIKFLFLGRIVISLVTEFVFSSLSYSRRAYLLYIQIGIGLLFLLGYILRIILATDYVVNDNEILFVRGMKIEKTFRFDEHKFSSFVVNNYINGIPTGKKRQLIVYTDLSETNYTMHLNEKDFDSFMSLVLNHQNKLVVQDVNDETELAHLNKTYHLDKSRIALTLWKENLLFIVPTTVVLVVFNLLNLNVSIKRSVYSSLALGIVSVYVVVLAIMFYNISIKKKKTPEIINVTASAITIDEEYITFNSMVKVSMTPPSYESGNQNRKLVIHLDDGTKKVYYLGFKKNKASVFNEYENLAHILQRTCTHREGVFQFDL